MALCYRSSLAAALALLAHAASAQSPGEPGRFEYLVLALSWSPSWCEDNRQGDQCRPGRGLGFVVHGLWPQYGAGGYPAFCAGAAKIPSATEARLLALMPSLGLVRHQWKKHGTCHGPAPEAYADAVERAFARIRIPETLTAPAAQQSLSATELEAEFVRANPGLSLQAIALVCGTGRLNEVRICLDRDLGFRECGPGVADTCGKTARVPSVTSRPGS